MSHTTSSPLQKPLAIAAIVVIVVQATAVLYLVFTGPDKNEDHYARILTSIDGGASRIQEAFKDQCTLDGVTPVKRLEGLIEQLDRATQAVTDCAAIGSSVTAIKDETGGMLEHLKLNLPGKAATIDEIKQVWEPLTKEWPTADEWKRLRRLPDAFACDGGADVGCLDGQLALGAEKNIIKQGSDIFDQLSKEDSPLTIAIHTAAKGLKESTEAAVTDLKSAIDGPALAREALRVLNEPGTPVRVEATISSKAIVVRLRNDSTFACSDLSASIAMIEHESVAKGGQSSLPKSIIVGSASGPDPVDIRAETQISLSLRALMQDSDEVCQAEFGIGPQTYDWFTGKLATHQLRVEISMVHPGSHHRVQLAQAGPGG